MTRGVMFGFLLLSMVMIIAGVYGFVHLYFRPDAVLFIDADFALMAGLGIMFVLVGYLQHLAYMGAGIALIVIAILYNTPDMINALNYSIGN